MKLCKFSRMLFGTAWLLAGTVQTLHATPLTLNSIVTGSLTVPGQQAIYTFEGSPGQRVFYDALEADFDAINARILNPAGAVVHVNQNSDSDGGPFTLTDKGTYTLMIDGVGAAVGDYSFRLLDLASQPQLTFNSVINNTLNPGFSCEWYRFTAVGGERLFFDGLGANSGGSWVLFGPGNEGLGSAGIGADFEMTLTQPGVHLLAISGNAPNPVPYSVQVLTAKTTTKPLQFDTSVSGTIGSPGDMAVYTFAGTPGQRIFYDALEANFDAINVRLLNPAGSLVHLNQNADSDGGPYTLLDAGTYSLVLDGNGASTGTYAFQLRNLAGLPVLALNTTISKTLTPGYSVEWYALNGTAGQMLYFDGLGANSGGSWTLFGPNNENIGANGIGTDFEVTLAQSGNYLLALAGNSASPVPYSVQVGTIAVSTTPLALGTTVNATIDHPGDRASFTFQGNAGQRLYFDSLDRDSEPINARLLAPTGAVVWEVNHSSDVGPFTLVQKGSYTLVLDGIGATVGDYSFRMLDLASAAAISLTAPVSGALSPRSRTDAYQFTGTKGQRISFDSISATSGDATWRLVNAANQTLTSGSILTDIPSAVLADGGDMLVLIEGTVENVAPLNYQVRLADVSDAPVAASGLNQILSGTLSGTSTTNKFTAPSGLMIYLDSQDRTSGGVAIDLRDPANTLLLSLGASTDSGPYLLPTSGTYSVVVRGTGSYRFRLLNLATDAAPLAFGTEVQSNLDPGYRTDLYKFTAAVGKRLLYDALENDFDSISVRLLAPDGVYRINGNSDSDSGVFTLTVPGTYYLFVESLIATVADYRFRLLDADAGAAITVGTLVNGTLTPGLGTALYRLAGTQGRYLFFDATASNSGGQWALYSPNNEVLQAPGIAQDFELSLPQTGEYLLALIGNSPNPVDYSFQVVDPNAGAADEPTITSINWSLATVNVEWTAVSGRSYSLQFKADLGDATWTDIAGPVVASGPTASKTDTVTGAPRRFYRVKQAP